MKAPESTAHDLGVINASLRLGDKFFPPEGALCSLKYYETYKYHCIVKVTGRVDHNRPWPRMPRMPRIKARIIEWLDDCVDIPRLPDHEIFWSLRKLSEILEVPAEAPPFEDWERP